MTLLNTVSNLAGMWPGTLSLWLVDNVSFKDCEGVTDFSLDCDTMQELQVGLVYYIQWNPIFIRDINECVDFFQGLLKGFNIREVSLDIRRKRVHIGEVSFIT